MLSCAVMLFLHCHPERSEGPVQLAGRTSMPAIAQKAGSQIWCTLPRKSSGSPATAGFLYQE
jgi:hypothetical protein